MTTFRLSNWEPLKNVRGNDLCNYVFVTLASHSKVMYFPLATRYNWFLIAANRERGAPHCDFVTRASKHSRWGGSRRYAHERRGHQRRGYVSYTGSSKRIDTGSDNQR